MSDSFQIFRPSSMRASSRLVCSSGLASSPYFSRVIPSSTMAFSTPGIICRKCLACSSVQNPITRSTPARLYQLRSKITTSPAAGRCGMYRWAYICDFSRSVGAGSATTRKMRGLTRSVIALIVPPLPAPSRPSKRMQTLRPLCTTHCWSLTNSTCKRASSRSYSLSFSLPLASGLSSLASFIGSSLCIGLHIQPFLRKWRQSVLLPGENEPNIAGHAPRILEHFSLEVEAERPEVIVPEFVYGLGAALQGRFPVGLRVVDPSAPIAAHRIWKAIDLDFALSALGRMAYQRHHDLHQLLGCPLERFVKLLHHHLLLFLLLLHMAQFFGGLRRLVLGHSTLHISSGKSARPCRLCRAAIFGHSVPSFLSFSF